MKKYGILILAACTAFGLGGCVGRSAGGEKTAQGMAAIEALDYSGALDDFKQAAADGEDVVLAYRGMGMAYMGMAQYDEAVNAFDEALSATDSKMPETVRDIRLYKASAQYRQKDYDGTIETCNMILAGQADSADALYLRGASYLNEDFQDKAKEDFDAAVAQTPQDYTLYLNIYESYESRNLSALGDDYLQTALNITPKSADDYYRIGQIYYYLEQYDQAQSVLLSPVEEKYLPAMYLMGRIYLAQEDYTHAASMYGTLQQLDQNSAEACNGLALCSIESGDYDQALTYISQGLSAEEDTGKQELYFNEIVVYERKLDFATAKEKAESYVQRYPTDEAGQKEMEFLSTR